MDQKGSPHRIIIALEHYVRTVVAGLTSLTGCLASTSSTDSKRIRSNTSPSTPSLGVRVSASPAPAVGCREQGPDGLCHVSGICDSASERWRLEIRRRGALEAGGWICCDSGADCQCSQGSPGQRGLRKSAFFEFSLCQINCGVGIVKTKQN